MKITNTSQRTIKLPDGTTIMAGATADVTKLDEKNAVVKAWLTDSVLVKETNKASSKTKSE